MKKSVFGSLIIVVMVLFACQKEPVVVEPQKDTDAISFTVKEAVPFSTKSSSDISSESYSEVIFTKDSIDVYLNVNESNFYSDFFEKENIESKGVPYANNNIGNFYVSALFSNMDLFFNGLQLNSTDGSSVSTGYYWPISTPPTLLNFFGYAINGGNGTISDQNYSSLSSGSFKYSLPDNSDNKSAENQPDMLFAISPEQKNTGNPVNMNFYHALSALEFSVGTVPGNLKIESVKFTNIYSSGSCEYSLESGGIDFDWSFVDSDTKTSYTQTFEKNLFSEGNVPLPDDSAINIEDQTFMMIPQSITDETEIEITISFEERPYTIKKQLNKLTGKWEPGKLYTFKISSPEEVRVEITDEVVMDGIYPVKQNLQIKNAGIADAYIRVAIAGTWVVDHTTSNNETSQLIISDWKEEDGEFTWPAAGKPVEGITNSNNWQLGSDGYYYYMKKTARGEVLKQLFDKYKLTAPSPMSGAYLELSILTQGILEGDVDELFPVDIKAKLSVNKH